MVLSNIRDTSQLGFLDDHLLKQLLQILQGHSRAIDHVHQHILRHESTFVVDVRRIHLFAQLINLLHDMQQGLRERNVRKG